MRTAFIETLCELAAQDERIWLLTGDLGYSVLERFSTRFPERYLNVGVAEQNMVGIAAGLALCGQIVFIYSIANFPIMRCLEQIRNDVCYHQLDVKIVAVGGGLTYGSAGYTHQAVEDLAIMQALPYMTVLAPGDPVETELATRAATEQPGPCYLRLGKAGEPRVHQQPPDFQIGRAILLRQGYDLTLVSTGGMLKTALDTVKLLDEQGITARLLSMPTLKPLDTPALLAAAAETPLLVTLEEHSINGGLYSAVCTALASSATPRLALALPTPLPTLVGSQSYMLDVLGLAPTRIAAAITERMQQLQPGRTRGDKGP